MSGVTELSVSARRAIFEAMVAMVWADTRLEREEILAIQAAGRVLELPDDVLEALDVGPPSIDQIVHDDLSATDRHLVYICAAWTSTVDGHEAEAEHGLLLELRDALGVDPAKANELRDDARMLHVTVPSRMQWWEELATLIERAHDTL